MTAEEIMNRDARWETCDRTAWNCDDAICPVTNHADLRESWALHEDTLRAQDIMGEAMKKPPHLSVTGVEEGGYERL